jgi:hypothetical protein
MAKADLQRYGERINSRKCFLTVLYPPECHDENQMQKTLRRQSFMVMLDECERLPGKIINDI